MKRTYAFNAVLLFFISLLVCCHTSAEPINKSAIDIDRSILDLSKESWGQGQIHSLKSSWLFTWETFTHTKKPPQTISWQNVHVPGSWSHHFNEQPKTESPLPPIGYGTYYKKILVPKHIDKFYLHLPDMASAYELWHNNTLLGGNGRISINKENESPGYLPSVYELKATDGVIEIFVKTSNFHYLWGGIWYAPSLTDKSGLHLIRDIPILKATTSGTILLATAVFCLLMYLSRRQDKKLLFFSLFCLAIGIRRLCMDERILYMLNSFSWETLQALENITLYLMLPLFLSYFQLVFPQTSSKKTAYVGWLCAIPFCAAAVTFKVEDYTGLNPYFQILVLCFLPFILWSWAQAYKAKLKHAKLFGLSLAIFVAAVINDMLNYSYVIRTTNLTHLGVLAFVLFQLTGLVSRYWDNFRAVESLSQTLKKQNEKLIQLDEFKDDFLASTSHELRMPLYGIAGLAKSVKQHTPNLASDSLKKVSLIEATANRLSHLVNDILDMSSMKHGKLNIQVSPTYLEPLIESTIHSLTPLLKKKPVSLNFNVEPPANKVLADEQRLQQIFYNLIGNAIKFTEKGSISIEARLHNDQVFITVTDTGIGMSPEQIAAASKPYESVQSQSPNDIRGSGLGLPITQMLVKLHKSKLTLQSTLGAGTTAQFTLPAAKDQPSSPPLKDLVSTENDEIDNNGLRIEESNASEQANKHVSKHLHTSSKYIFYADDEEVNRELISSQLTASGYAVETFADGQALLDRLPERLPELILLDWMMPGKNGLETCQEIRERHSADKLPIIMLTARQQINSIVQALNAGANDYLTKPYHEQELVARVQSQLSVHQLFTISIENERLKAEIARQEKHKQQLKHANSQLANTLDASHENTLLLNEDLDIIYANARAKDLLGIEPFGDNTSAENELSISSYINEEAMINMKNILNSSDTHSSFTLELKNDEQSKLEARVEKMDLEGESFLTLTLNHHESNADTQQLLSSLTQEIAENRNKMEQIESTLRQLNANKALSEAPSSSVNTSDSRDDPNELVVKTLRTTLISWERYTHKTKADLAEESHCWRVYLDGATAKTRTLDKYLSIKTLPAKPRWRAVIKTANYVLDNCELNDKDKQELSELVDRLTEAFS